VSVPDDAVEISGDSLTDRFEDIPNVDQLQFPGGNGTAPVTVTYEATYTKIGAPRKVRPTSSDPLSPFHWAGKMWMATNSGTFSVTYKDGSFSAQGSFSSSGNFGEMGTERNGSFLEPEDQVTAAGSSSLKQGQMSSAGVESRVNANVTVQERGGFPRLKGRVMLRGSYR
jgi:hypothetical protein